MKEVFDWAEKFKIAPMQLEAWKKEAGESEDLLRWCLLNGKINEGEYLEWAARHFELPIVESHFFALPPDNALWDKVKNEISWQPHLIPLHEWENVLLIACVQPVPLKLDRPHRFVIAAASSLNFLWASLGQSTAPAQGLASTPTQSEEKAEMPDGFLMKDSMVKPAEAFDFGGSSPEGTSAPDGLSLSALGTPPSLFDDKLPTLDVPVAPSDVTQPGFSPEVEKALISGQELNLSFDTPEQKPAEVKLDLPAAETKPAEPTPPTVAPPEPLQAVQVEPAGMPPAPPAIPPFPTSTAEVLEQKTSAKIEVADIDAAPAGFADVTNFPTSVTQAPAATSGARQLSQFTQATSIEEATDIAFGQMKKHFQKGILLVFQAGQLRPWRWSGNVTYAGKGKPGQIDLEVPSIFRIPFKTGLPYHGYVTPNPINNAFFTQFNAGATPKHVTIMPLMVSGRITGMLMGLTDDPIDLRATLRQMEGIAEQLGQSFATLRSKKAA